VISRLACSLAGRTEQVAIAPGTRAHAVYGKEQSTEHFRCSYGLNPAYRAQVMGAGLAVSGVDRDGEVRIVELPDRRFYVATLFLPQLGSSPGQPHPLIVAYVRAALAFQALRRDAGL
jgi:CTP synthase (UTP-ammonia lyase)